MVNNQNPIRIEDGGQAVGNNKTRTPFHQFGHGLLNQSFSAGIHRTGRFIEDQHGGIGENGPGNGNQLFLSLEIAASSAKIVSYPSGKVRMK